MSPSSDPTVLTSRQREVLSLLARNWSAKRIASELRVSPAAVKATVSRIRKQLGVPEPASMAAAALAYELAGRVDLRPEVLRHLFMEAPMAIAVLRGADHVVELVNDEGRRLVGGRELVGRAIRNSFPQIEAEPYLELLDDAYESGTRHVARGTAISWGRGDGAREHVVDVVFEPLRDAAGGVDGTVAFVHEVTAAVHAQERREGPEAYRFPILQHVSDGVLIFGRDGVLALVNPAARRLLGPQLSEGRSVGDLLAQWNVRRAATGARVDLSDSSVMAALRGAGPVDGDYVVTRPDTGDDTAVHGTSLPLRMKDGRVHAAAFIFALRPAGSPPPPLETAI